MPEYHYYAELLGHRITLISPLNPYGAIAEHPPSCLLLCGKLIQGRFELEEDYYEIKVPNMKVVATMDYVFNALPGVKEIWLLLIAKIDELQHMQRTSLVMVELQSTGVRVFRRIGICFEDKPWEISNDPDDGGPWNTILPETVILI